MAITRRVSAGSRSKANSLPLPSSSMVTRSSARRQSGGPAIVIDNHTEDAPSAPKRSRENDDDDILTENSRRNTFNNTKNTTKRARVIEFPPKPTHTLTRPPNRLSRCQRNKEDENTAGEGLKIRIKREEPNLQVDDSDDDSSSSLSDSEAESEEDSDYFSYDELPNFQYESRYTQGVDEDGNTHDKENPFDMETINTDIPLVDLTVDDEDEASHLSFEKFVEDSSQIIAERRWPINEQDDSSTFSILVKTEQTITTTTPVKSDITERAVNIMKTNSSDSNSEPSIEEFLDYDSAAGLTDDESDSDCSSASSPSESPVSPSIPSTSLSRPFWTDKYHNIPICGYRDRHSNDLIPTIVTPNQSKFIAALSTISTNQKVAPSPMEAALKTAYYQQAVIAAVGLNKRSLWSGKARQMVSGGDRPL